MTDSPARWCAALAELLADVSTQVGVLAARIVEDWSDERGRAQAERAAVLHRELARDARAAEELAGTLAAQEAAAGGIPLVGQALRRRRGMQLGGTAAERVDPALGMRLAEQPD
ncbi:hypothetical protein [Pseudonocardia sp. TRM90224]|uniref:hypothetical protein n=1 Tax=Pseudonocardia sp. TRM90224 TaxID=2812678 RepID=UPI001E3F7B72|nr:hypothetical protein [Pseudonocardia sp. TRM90224]